MQMTDFENVACYNNFRPLLGHGVLALLQKLGALKMTCSLFEGKTIGFHLTVLDIETQKHLNGQERLRGELTKVARVAPQASSSGRIGNKLFSFFRQIGSQQGTYHSIILWFLPDFILYHPTF